jgi:hypothetical protein
MTVYYKLATAIATLIVCISVNAVTPQAKAQVQVMRVKTSQLGNTPLASGPLRITITRVNWTVLGLGVAYMEIEVHNASDEFVTFSPQRLSFVSKDFTQADVLGRVFRAHDLLSPRDRRIAPRATIEEAYRLDQNLDLPVRVYYEDKLLAEVTN